MTAQLLTIVIIVIDVSGGLSERTMGQPFLFVWGFIIIIIIIMHPLTNRVSIMKMTNRRQPKCMKFRKYVQNYSQRCLSEKQIAVQLPGVPTPASSFAGGFCSNSSKRALPLGFLVLALTPNSSCLLQIPGSAIACYP